MFAVSLILVAVLVAADQILKLLVNSHIELHKVIEVIRFGSFKVFSLTHIRNQGAAWSIMEGKKWFLVGLPLAVCAAAFIYLYKMKDRDKIDVIPVALIVAGGIGNLIDRIRIGEVIDYILFEPVDFPIFNFADICVVIGAILFAVALLTEEKRGYGSSGKKKTAEPEEKDEKA